jgi:type IV pilus assembly protein PilE
MRRGRGSGRRDGFTLIELVVAVLIIGLLAAIAIPSYSAYIVRGKRAEARVALLEAAQFMERSYTANGCYAGDTTGGVNCVVPVLPASLSKAPVDGTTSNYVIALDPAVPGPQAFRLVATPCGDAGAACAAPFAPFTDADCDSLRIDNTGVKDIAGTFSLTPDQCWGR